MCFPTPTVAEPDISSRRGSFLLDGTTYDRCMRRLDEDKLEQLRRWGTGLAGTEDQELRATGKAILLLIEEVEALHVELWNAKAAATRPEEPEHDPEPEVVPHSGDSLDGTLGARLRRLRRRSASEHA